MQPNTDYQGRETPRSKAAGQHSACRHTHSVSRKHRFISLDTVSKEKTPLESLRTLLALAHCNQEPKFQCSAVRHLSWVGKQYKLCWKSTTLTRLQLSFQTRRAVSLAASSLRFAKRISTETPLRLFERWETGTMLLGLSAKACA